MQKYRRSNGDADLAEHIRALEALLPSLKGATGINSLMGLEGTAARHYFAAFGMMVRTIERIIKPKEDDIKIYGLCRNCLHGIRVIGIGKVAEEPDAIIV